MHPGRAAGGILEQHGAAAPPDHGAGRTSDFVRLVPLPLEVLGMGHRCSRLRSADPVLLPDQLSLLADRVCLEILIAVARVPRDVTALAARLDLALPHVSRNLGDLSAAGLVQAQRNGRQKVYHPGPALSTRFTGDGALFRITDEEGSAAELRLSVVLLAALEGTAIQITDAAVLARPGSVPTPRRSPSGL